MPRRLFSALLVSLALAVPAAAVADTPERDSPYQTRQSPDDQYQSPGNGNNGNNGNPGNTCPPAKDASSGDGAVLGARDGRDGGGGAGQSAGGDEARPVSVAATQGDGRATQQLDGDEGLPFTGSPLGVIVGVALVLLFAGALLRVAQRRLRPTA